MKRALKSKKPPALPADLAALDDRLLNTSQAAAFLGYTSAHMRKVRCAGEGPTWIVMPNGYSVRYRLGDLRAFIRDAQGVPA